MPDTRSTRERAYEYIQRKIIDGELPAGGLISELALSREFGSSRTPIREAIGQLAAEGFLEQLPNRGMVVVQFTRADILDLYDLREALETHAVRKVAYSGMSDSEVQHLRQVMDGPLRLIQELENAGQAELSAGQMKQFMSDDMAFHSLLIHSAGNRRMLKVVNETRLLIRIFGLRRSGHTATQLRRICSDHGAVLDAILHREPEAAAERVARHIQGSRDERLEAYDAWDRNVLLNGGIA